MHYKKQFLILGNTNIITYKQIFPLFKENKVWFGVSHGDMSFKVPDNYPPRKTRYWVDDSGQKWRSMGNIEWVTNLDYSQRHEDLILYKHYLADEYPKFDNYDAIDVDKTADIPLDYDGYIGVPITFLDKYSPDQFEIINANDVRTADDGKVSRGLIKNADGAITLNGKTRRTYARVVIRNKKVQK